MRAPSAACRATNNVWRFAFSPCDYTSSCAAQHLLHTRFPSAVSASDRYTVVRGPSAACLPRTRLHATDDAMELACLILYYSSFTAQFLLHMSFLGAQKQAPQREAMSHRLSFLQQSRSSAAQVMM